MDIQKWLDDTAEVHMHAPPNPAQTPGSGFFQRPEKPKPVFKEKHAPKRCKSDSSLLDPQPHPHKAPPKESKPPTEGSLDASAYSEVSRPSRSDSAESVSSNHRYARKPRRKTRLERYEPKPVKERGKHIHHSRKDESNKTRRESKRRKGEKLGSGVAQSFRAKNVSGDRLTLKPREQLGIFNKGRTSMAVRGRGLPDLVFSEMKFLQKEKDPPEPAPQQTAPKKKKRKKDHAHTKEGEISAFFTSVRPALAEKNNNAQTHGARELESTAPVTGRHERERSTKSSGVVATIEVHEKGPFLGFGSRGPRHESTSYVSWSDSVHAPEVTSQRPKQFAPMDDQQRVSTQQTASTTAGGEGDIFKRPAPRTAKCTTHDSREHFMVSPVDRSDSHQRASRSHSYPQRTSSPRKVNLVDRTTKVHSIGPADSPSSMPPSVPTRTVNEPQRQPTGTARTTRQHRVEQSRHQQDTQTNEEVEAEIGPQTSSDLERVIQQCHRTFHERRRVSPPQRRHTVQSEAPLEQDIREGNSGAGVNRLRQVRFSGLDMPSPVAPNFPGPGIYEQQAHRQTMPSDTFYDDEEILGGSHLTGQEYIDNSNDILCGEPDWEGYPREPAGYDLGIEAQDYSAEETPVSGEMVQHLPSDNSIVAPGFWRPNRLY
ncbi:hypothetical protein CC86DRAFT_463214 [Ophiobolus disseminans]|uniref:Uncharacterized protein n=1 Tax=Ophiobolus disseminans TaxID=1469910 RepID=A0A6A7AEI6_9PLEO|nr:hypothetical protein CC86DRAFT_463214 [Ophiobolus disseminans]